MRRQILARREAMAWKTRQQALFMGHTAQAAFSLPRSGASREVTFGGGLQNVRFVTRATGLPD